MQRFIATCILAFALSLTACSTIMEGSQEEVLLTTPGAPGSRCYVRNEYFLYVINPPRRFQLERTSKPYKIVCVAPGNRVKTVILPVGFERSTIYNVSNGVVPGVATDLASGALFRYPDEIAIDFTDMKPRPMPLPDYQLVLEQNPLMKGMEQFRPSVPALQSDANTQVTPMEKRDPNSVDDIYGMSLLSPADVTGSSSSQVSSSSSSSTSSSPLQGTGTNGGNVAPTVSGGASTGYGSFRSPGAGSAATGTTTTNGTSTTPATTSSVMRHQGFSNASTTTTTTTTTP